MGGTPHVIHYESNAINHSKSSHHCIIVHSPDLLFGSVPHSFFDPGGFALAASQVIQPGSSDFALPDDLNFIDAGRDDRKYSFYADAVGYFPDGERFTVRTGVFALNDYALKLLDTFFVALPYLYVYIDCITCFKGRMVFPGFLVFFFYKF